MFCFMPLLSRDMNNNMFRYIWEWGRHMSVQHDAYTCHKFSNTIGWPTQRLKGSNNFVAAVVGDGGGLWRKCPKKCRRKGHLDWEHCWLNCKTFSDLKYEHNKFINQCCILRLVSLDALQCTEDDVVSYDR